MTKSYPDLASLRLVPCEHLRQRGYAVLDGDELRVCDQLYIRLQKHPKGEWEKVFQNYSSPVRFTVSGGAGKRKFTTNVSGDLAGTVIVAKGKRIGDAKSIFFSRHRRRPEAEGVERLARAVFNNEIEDDELESTEAVA